MPEELSEEHHNWMSSFFGVDTRQGASSNGGGSGVLGAISNAVSGAVNTVEQTASAAISTVGTAVETVEHAASSVVTSVEKTVSGAVDTVEKTAGAAVDTVKKAAGSALHAGGAHVGKNPPPETPADSAHTELFRDDAKDQASGTETDIHKKINESDINQGQIGDCFVLSSAGEIAKLRPDVIKSMIQDNHDGTYTVTLHKKKSGIGNLWGLFDSDYEEVKVKVNANVPEKSVNHGAGDAQDGDKKVSWPLILEKAYAQVNGGYAEINKGGDPADALGQLTGKKAATKETSDVTLDDVEAAVKSGKPMTFNTPDDEDGILEKIGLFKSKKLPFGMHGGHAYMFEGLEKGPDGKQYVRLKNPWGYDDPQLIPFDQLKSAVSSVSTGEI